MGHYNTTKEKGQRLQEFQAKALSQDQVIIQLFERMPDELYTPWEVRQLAFAYPWPPITSVRRSITDMTRAGILQKTDVKKEVAYGRPSYCWRLNPVYNETQKAMQTILGPSTGEIKDPVDIDHAPERTSTDGPENGVTQGVLFEPEACYNCKHCVPVQKSVSDITYRCMNTIYQNEITDIDKDFDEEDRCEGYTRK